MNASTVQEGGAFQRASRSWPMPVPLRRVLLLVPPLLLAGLEVLHPQPDETVQSLMDASTWFAAFHFIQLALTGLVGLSVLLLADSFGRANAWVTRLGVGVFLVFFSAYDAVAGIGTGLAMRSARDLSTVQQEGVFDVVEGWPAFGAAVRAQHYRNGRLGGRSRCARSGSSPSRRATSRMDPRGPGGSVPDGWAPVSIRNARVRLLLHRGAPTRATGIALARQSDLT